MARARPKFDPGTMMSDAARGRAVALARGGKVRAHLPAPGANRTLRDVLLRDNRPYRPRLDRAPGIPPVMPQLESRLVQKVACLDERGRLGGTAPQRAPGLAGVAVARE